jgi:hypothetical protein
MRPVEIQVKINVARREMEFWQNLLQRKSCNDCENFQQGQCTQFNATPPPEVQQVGCDEWSWDNIPF